ncbi:RHS repeat-associated core domain-containing protein, partial [Citrobacter amalonaticus]|uniref:RHS repeat-associated core domain-containing protein n=1 Tax=Citrobacter amalonaticus TaxID=35703 RepID=UPI00300CFC72
VHTLYEPGSFTPLLRIEGEGGDGAYTCLADKLRQHSRIPFTAQEYADMERLEEELRTGKLSERSRGWLEFANIPANLMAAQLDPLPVVNIRNIHLYQCDHRGTPTALINQEGQTEWKAEVDPWGNVLFEDNPHNIEQPLRLPGQWYDEESGLHYNRHRYYDPTQGRYITQDPIGLVGGLNLYNYVMDNPVTYVDPKGLDTAIIANGPTNGNPIGHSAMAFSGKGVYSYGNDTPYGSSVTTYLSAQAKRRDTKIYILRTTPGQEEEMQKYILEHYKSNGDYNLFTHNCASMTVDALDSAGVAREGLLEVANSGLPLSYPPSLALVGMRESMGPGIDIPQGGSIPISLQEFNPK